MKMTKNLDIEDPYLKQKWLYELNLQEKESQLKYFNKELNKNEDFLTLIRNLLEIIYFLIDFIGTDFKEDSSGVLYACYNYFIFGVKAMMMLQDFLTFADEKRKNDEINYTPTLSRLNTKDYSLELHGNLSRKFSKNYEKISFKTLEESFKYLYYKMSAVIGQFKNSPSTLALSNEIKFSYLKWRSISKAKKYANFMDYEDNEILIKIKREHIWHSTLETLLEIPPNELILRQIKINFENEIGSDFGFFHKSYLN